MRRALSAVLAAGLACPAAAQGPVERLLLGAASVMTEFRGGRGTVYFPAFKTDPNAGPTYGVMPVWLWLDDAGAIRHIVAPSATHNAILGVTGTARYFFYPDAYSKLFAVAARSAHSDFRLAVRYNREPRREGPILDVYANHEAEGTKRFFGVGARSAASAETDYRWRQDEALLGGGWKFAGRLSLRAAWEARTFSLGGGALADVPDLPAARRERVFLSMPRLRAAWDTRDLPATPTRGNALELAWGLSSPAFGSDRRFASYGALWQGYAPHAGGAAVLAARGLLDWNSGGDVPLSAMARLGGLRSLRGFGEGRFVDRGRAAVALEERLTVYELPVVGTRTRFQVAPFLEAGRVFERLGALDRRDWNLVGGVALRGVVPPTVVGTIDLGWSREGLAAFVDVDYPF